MTEDAGRWRDSMDPAGRIKDMCSKAINYYRAQEGTMILVNRNDSDCSDLVNYAKQQESWHSDWFLWSEIECGYQMKMFIK